MHGRYPDKRLGKRQLAILGEIEAEQPIQIFEERSTAVRRCQRKPQQSLKKVFMHRIVVERDGEA